jgi:signal transduction histidine kinase
MTGQTDDSPHFADPTDATRRIAELEAAVTARDQFIATIGHEMRNPMVPIVLAVDRLRRFADAGDWARVAASLNVLDRAAAAFMRRATQLLDMSRFANGHFVLQQVELDLSALVEETAARHVDIARRAACDFSWQVEPGIVVVADQPAVEQLLDNVLANAFKYGAARPVFVSLVREPGYAAVRVADRGNGIEKEAQTRIFALFERTRTIDAPGLGIGLWMASRLATAMGGTIDVESTPGEGAEFIIRLPLHKSAADQENRE